MTYPPLLGSVPRNDGAVKRVDVESAYTHDGAHTAPKDAARIARMGGVGRLVLIHYARARAEEIVADARAVFPRSSLAVEGESIELT